MLQLQTIRQEKERIIEGLKKKNFKDLDLVEKILTLDEEKRFIQHQSETIAADINAASKSIGQLMASGDKVTADTKKREIATLKEEAKLLTEKLSVAEDKLRNNLLLLPNIPHSSVPEGKTPEDNTVIKTYTPTSDTNINSQNGQPHWELAAKHELINFELGNKITGSGFPVYIGQGAKLQRSLIQYFLDYNINEGYKEYYPPHMVNEASAYGTGQLPDKEGQMYHITADNFYMIPTAEVPITNIYRDEIIKQEDMPIKMTAYTPCFRREAGSYGKDVRGLNRLHQFDKVEIVQITTPQKSYEALDKMVEHVEKLLQSLELPYRILRLCGGDMSFTSALTYDFEVFSKAQERWLEVSSVSNFEAFQSNRMKIRYRDENGKPQLAHTLNGSSLALPRIMACLLENHQTTDGIHIPKALQPFFGKSNIQ